MDVWSALSVAERRAVVDALPSDVESVAPPEGDPHRIPKQRALEALEAFFRRKGRNVYLSSELPVYYPGEEMFAPDLIAVLDAEPRERLRWVVAEEGKGLTFAMEVTLHGSRQKDLERNVERFARLGIPEYFAFDRRQCRLHAWRLTESGQYAAIVPQLGRWESMVLGLELAVEENRVRFYAGTALVPETQELLSRANALADALQDRLALAERVAEEEKERADREKERADREKERADAAERRARALEEELDRQRR
jgi:Uma2 family endonuclease